MSKDMNIKSPSVQKDWYETVDVKAYHLEHVACRRLNSSPESVMLIKDFPLNCCVVSADRKSVG